MRCDEGGSIGWLAGWAKRIKCIIDHNDVDGALSHFPVLVYLSTSSGRTPTDVTAVFDEVGANRKKIAVTKSDGTTQLYVEVEKWDFGNEKAWLWVSRSGWSISNVADTDLYLYYDNTQADNNAFVGDPSDAVVHNVWDASHKLVTHMRDDPDNASVRDSTVNANDGAKLGADEPAVTAAGQIDDAQNFDGTNDYILAGALNEFHLQPVTMEAWVKADFLDTNWRIILTLCTQRLLLCAAFVNGETANRLAVTIYDGAYKYAEETGLSTGTWYHIVGVVPASGGTARFYRDGVERDTFVTGAVVFEDSVLAIGADNVGNYRFDGIIDEVRVSDVERPAAWVKASYESGRDDLIAYGSEELLGWTGKISGVTNPAEVAGVPVANIAKVKGVA